MLSSSTVNKRVVVLFWKCRTENPFEIFSNLKNLCLSYPQYNYNTLNNYLSKEKVPYENDIVRIERKNVILKPIETERSPARKIIPVVRQVKLKEIQEAKDDVDYWLQQPVISRAAAVTFIISQSLKKGARMDKTIVIKKKMKK